MDTLFPRRWQPLILASLLAGTAILFFGWNDGPDNELAGWVVVTLLAVLTAYALWRFVVVPRLHQPADAALPAVILGALSVVLGFMYWTGIVYGLAPAAIALGYMSRGTNPGRAGLALGIVGLGLAIVGGFVDGVL